MEGYVQINNNQVNFGFSVPLPSLNGEYFSLSISNVSNWNQRIPPKEGIVIYGNEDGFWGEAPTPKAVAGIYLGKGLVLIASLRR